MGVFRFKQFEVLNEASPMKVGTDGVLLGAAVTLYPGKDLHVLDAGSGTGVIALMLAQRLLCHPGRSEGPFITGIDIDAASAEEAGLNFARSPWAYALEARHCALRDFVPPAPLDLIVSNPPYFEDSLLPPEQRRGFARHAAGPAFSFADLADFAAAHLRPGGRLSVILPADQETSARRYAASVGVSLFRILRVRTTPGKPVSRIVLEFTQAPFFPFDRSGGLPCIAASTPFPFPSPSESLLTIMDPRSYPDNKNGYTPEYLTITSDFYL